MEFREVVRRRRMVRAYRDQPVAPEVLARLVDTARRAPSAGFSQGQRFLVVTDPELRATVASLAGEDDYTARGYPAWLSQAPAHIVVCADVGAYMTRYGEPDKAATAGEPGRAGTARAPGGPPVAADWPVPYWHVDAGAALMLLLLAAVDENLAAGFLGVHRLRGLRDLLGIPQGVEPVGLVTVGHPLPDRRSRSLQRGRLPLERVLFWDRWPAQER